MKKIIIFLLITFSIFGKNKYDRNKIYFDICTQECFKIIGTDGFNYLKYKIVECSPEQRKYFQEEQIKQLPNIHEQFKKN